MLARLWVSKSLANISLLFSRRAGRGAMEARLRLRKRSLQKYNKYEYQDVKIARYYVEDNNIYAIIECFKQALRI